MASLDTSFILGLLVVIVVGFFAHQWMLRRSTTVLRPSTKPIEPSAGSKAVAASASVEIAGQTPAETSGKEPLQQSQQSGQQPIQTSSFPNASPAQFTQNLRHPEQSFHQPSGLAANPQFQQTSDVASGRAGTQQMQTNPGQQSFSPEMAQNGGLLMGNSVMAFDSEAVDPVGGGLAEFY